MNNRERRSKKGENDPKAVPYSGNEFTDYVQQFTSDSIDSASAMLFVPALIASYDRGASQMNYENAAKVYDAAMNLLENSNDDLSDAQLLDLLHLSTVALLDMEDSPPLVFDQWAQSVFKWFLRNKDVRNDADAAELFCACVALVETTFRPQVLLDAHSAVTCFPLLARLIDATQDAFCRGQYVQLAAMVARDPLDPFSPLAAHAGGGSARAGSHGVSPVERSEAGGGAAAFPKKSVDVESEVAAKFIESALTAPDEDLCIAGMKAAAVFFDRFGGDGGLDPAVLGIGCAEPVEIPNEAQRKVGVSKVNVEKACKDVVRYLRSGQEERPSEKLSENIDLKLEQFDRLYLKHCISHVYPSGPENVMQRTNAAVFRVAVIGMNWQKPFRDRAHGIGKHAEQYLLRTEKRKSDRLRDKDRGTRRMLDQTGARDD